MSLATHRFDFAWSRALGCYYTWYIIFQQVQPVLTGFIVLHPLTKGQENAPTDSL